MFDQVIADANTCKCDDFLKKNVNANAMTFCECMPVQIMINLLKMYLL